MVMMVVGIKEAALQAYDDAEERRRWREQNVTPGQLASRAQHTEDWMRRIFTATVDASAGFIRDGSVTLGARFVDLGGHTAWWLCLLEQCERCGAEMETPFTSKEDLGRVLRKREEGERPYCVRYERCEARVRQQHREALIASSVQEGVPTS